MSLKKFHNLAKNKLFTICRSITGNGVRETLKEIKKNFPKLKILEIPSGSKAFDWTVPPEWNITNAFVLDKNGKKIIDFKKNNLHLIGYSKPINQYVSKKTLLSHIYSLPKQPLAIPYMTSYYKRFWGFCINHKEKILIEKKYKESDKFKVFIDSSLNNKGNLTYGEFIIKGKSKQEILISTYICHPSMANNELSGPIVSMSLMSYYQKIKNLNKTIRFIFIPETIGSIIYLHKHLEYLKENVIGGYNLSCLGDNRQYSFMPTKYDNTLSDFAAKKAFKKLRLKYRKYSFLERGSDERQYNSPGIDLPISSIFRTKYGCYPEYHTSLDNFNLVTLKGLNGGYRVVKTAIDYLLQNIIPKNNFLCEPQMGKRKLYPTLSIKKAQNSVRDYMNFIQYADGKNDLKQISDRIKLKYKDVVKIYRLLKKRKIVR